MSVNQLEIFYEDLDVSDEKLIDMLSSLRRECRKRRRFYDEARKDFDENNYCNFLMAKLYYEFCEEEYHNLCNEANRRRLIVQ